MSGLVIFGAEGWASASSVDSEASGSADGPVGMGTVSASVGRGRAHVTCAWRRAVSEEPSGTGTPCSDGWGFFCWGFWVGFRYRWMSITVRYWLPGLHDRAAEHRSGQLVVAG